MSGHLVGRVTTMLVTGALLAGLAATTLAAPASAKPKCAGRVATIVGTNKGEVIRGTPKNDVIVAKGGHDIIRGGGGNDTICGNNGNDKLDGGSGQDLLLGQTGRDKLSGGPGRDRLLGGPANDSFNGGTGNDACFQGSGTGPWVNCERPVPEPPKMLVVAFSDIDGIPGYTSGDVMVSRLLDTNRDGRPGAGDTIEMGRYPLDWTASTFGEWREKSHAVTGIFRDVGDNRVWVTTAAGIMHWFHDPAAVEWYCELGGQGAYQSCITDGWTQGPPIAYWDGVDVKTTCPSRPISPVDVRGPNYSEDGFIDVEIYLP